VTQGGESNYFLRNGSPWGKGRKEKGELNPVRLKCEGEKRKGNRRKLKKEKGGDLFIDAKMGREKKGRKTILHPNKEKEKRPGTEKGGVGFWTGEGEGRKEESSAYQGRGRGQKKKGATLNCGGSGKKSRRKGGLIATEERRRVAKKENHGEVGKRAPLSRGRKTGKKETLAGGGDGGSKNKKNLSRTLSFVNQGKREKKTGGQHPKRGKKKKGGGQPALRTASGGGGNKGEKKPSPIFADWGGEGKKRRGLDRGKKRKNTPCCSSYLQACSARGKKKKRKKK